MIQYGAAIFQKRYMIVFFLLSWTHDVQYFGSLLAVGLQSESWESSSINIEGVNETVYDTFHFPMHLGH
jgi:hypothetical protein